jgi:hypothetical protein
MDFLKGKSRMEIKPILDILDDMLAKFVCKVASPRKGEKKFQHVTNFGCLQHPLDDPIVFLICWYLNHLVCIQNTFIKTRDLEKFGYVIKHTYINYGQEFSRIQHMFMKIINTDVLIETG